MFELPAPRLRDLTANTKQSPNPNMPTLLHRQRIALLLRKVSTSRQDVCTPSAQLQDKWLENAHMQGACVLRVLAAVHAGTSSKGAPCVMF
jgi:hypothetical protein